MITKAISTQTVWWRPQWAQSLPSNMRMKCCSEWMFVLPITGKFHTWLWWTQTLLGFHRTSNCNNIISPLLNNSSKSSICYLVACRQSVTESPREIPISKSRIFRNESFQNVSKTISKKEPSTGRSDSLTTFSVKSEIENVLISILPCYFEDFL